MVHVQRVPTVLQLGAGRVFQAWLALALQESAADTRFPPVAFGADMFVLAVALTARAVSAALRLTFQHGLLSATSCE